jgi:UDP-N-acetylglucosamine 4,6-dehydratase/5-epimerase
MFSGANILVTGATGSFGGAFLRRVSKDFDVNKLIVFSRDELKQYELRKLLGEDPRFRYFIGDIRDQSRLERAMHGVDFVVHAAALKQVDAAEYNPYEFIQTNVIGSQNVIEAAINSGVKKVIALSTDKASSPINLYGATKLAADKLFQSANHYSMSYGTSFSVVRYGNVLGSRGSIVPHFKALAAKGESLPVTDFRMTRFWITLDQAVDFVVSSLGVMKGGELFVPKIPSVRITDLIEAIAPGSKVHEIGIRPGEKLHEEMISEDDSRRTVEQSDRFVITPTIANWAYESPAGQPLPEGFSYRSNTNNEWLGASEIKNLLEEK